MSDGQSGFFSESSEQSRAKASIVADYFFAWATIIIPTAKQGSGRIAYIDLFAGPGRYEDGTRSTPLLILERAIVHPDMREMLVAMFNDAGEAYSASLQAAIDALPGIETLRHKPKVYTSVVDEETAEAFAKIRLVPTFALIDPWGYRGLSLPLIHALVKDWGCDCAFFFNYNRINMGLTNPMVESHMNAIFGENRLADLRARLPELGPGHREGAVMEMLTDALAELGGKYLLAFRFRNESGRVSHYLVFVTKHFRGYEVMKEIMAKHSSSNVDGVASFEFDPRDRRGATLELPFGSPIDELKQTLLEGYAGSRLTVRELFQKDSPGRPYVIRNYKDALKRLEAEGKVTMDPPAVKRRKREGEPTLADGTIIVFPLKRTPVR